MKKCTGMKLTPYERETVILYNEAEDTASVYTYDAKLLTKLRRLSQKYPDLIRPDKRDNRTFIVPKRCVSIREPYSEARRKADSERAKAAGRKPPGRSASAKTE